MNRVHPTDSPEGLRLYPVDVDQLPDDFIECRPRLPTQQLVRACVRSGAGGGLVDGVDNTNG